MEGGIDMNKDDWMEILLQLTDKLKEIYQNALKAYEERLGDISTDFALEYFRVFSIMDVSYSEKIDHPKSLL